MKSGAPVNLTQQSGGSLLFLSYLLNCRLYLGSFRGDPCFSALLKPEVTPLTAIGQCFRPDQSPVHGIAQSDIRDAVRGELDLPVLILEADMCDARLYNDGAIRERVAAFLEML